MQLATSEKIWLGSHQVARFLVLICGLMVVTLVWPAAAAPEAAPGAEVPSAGSIGSSWAAFLDWIAASYAQAPALVLGLVALIAVPPLAIVGWMARNRDKEQVEISQQRTQVRRVSRGKAADPRDGVRTGHIPLRPLEAWIEVVNRGDVAPSISEARYNLGRTLLRIGRETDNDVCLADTTVHRYHAAVHRTEDAEFVITDLSSAGGNGIVVNGRAVSEARLSNGDVIELGNARLKFLAAPRV